MSEQQSSADSAQPCGNFDPNKKYTNHLSVLIDAVGYENMQKVKAALSIAGYTIYKGTIAEPQASAVSARPVAWFCFVDAPKDDPEPLRIRAWTTDAERAKSIGQVIGRELEPLYRALPQTAPDSGVAVALAEARDEFEAIRLLLINDLVEPGRSAFWKAVNTRDKIAAILAAQSQAESVQREDQTPVSYQRRNIGPNGTPFSAWYPADDKPTPENMKFDGYLSYEYRPLYAGLPLSRPQCEGK